MLQSDDGRVLWRGLLHDHGGEQEGSHRLQVPLLPGYISPFCRSIDNKFMWMTKCSRSCRLFHEVLTSILVESGLMT